MHIQRFGLANLLEGGRRRRGPELSLQSWIIREGEQRHFLAVGRYVRACACRWGCDAEAQRQMLEPRELGTQRVVTLSTRLGALAGDVKEGSAPLIFDLRAGRHHARMTLRAELWWLRQSAMARLKLAQTDDLEARSEGEAHAVGWRQRGQYEHQQ